MSDKPRSTKPLSKMPSISSSKPSSKMPSISSSKHSSKKPKTEDEDAILASAMFKDISLAPSKSKVSSSSSRAPAKEQDKKAKSTFAPIPEDDILDEEYDDFEELTTPKSNYPELMSPSKKPQSRVPGKSAYYDANSKVAEKVHSIMPSVLLRDESKAAPGPTPEDDPFLQSGFFKDESKAPLKASSRAPKAGSIMPSIYLRDESRAPILPSSRFKDETFVPKSFLVTKEDKIMSSRQTEFSSLAPKEQKKQEEWAQKKIKEMKACPEQYDWVRIDKEGYNGYICAEGRHGMTDLLIGEGDGAMIILKVKHDLSEEIAGPWYPHPTIKSCYIAKERTVPLDGIKYYDQPAFFGSDHQRQRAKWEFYGENLDVAVTMGYQWPDKEPPKEWADEKNIPKTKEQLEAKAAGRKK